MIPIVLILCLLQNVSFNMLSVFRKQISFNLEKSK